MQTVMADFTIALDRSSPLGLQDQLRQWIVDAIHTGALRAGCKMPSSRALADRLSVSRNTVVLAYSELAADGYLEAHERSGIFVSSKSLDGRVVGRRFALANGSPITDMMASVPTDGGARCPQHWRQYPYPFLDGRIDASLVPLQDWRKAVRMASCPRDAMQWSEGNGELDDPMLIAEICTKVLPERGISALPEEVLVMASARQALQFLATLLVRRLTPVWLEEPVDPELLATLRERGARIEHFDPDTARAPPEGVIVVTGAPSGIASSRRMQPALVNAIARCNGIVIEQDTPVDALDAGIVKPALWASAGGGNVIYVGRLSPVVACGTPPAIVVSDAQVIARLRRLRRISGALPDPLYQRAWAYFLTLGCYTASLHKARRVLTARRTALRDALNHYLHADVQIEAMPGVSAYWVRCRDGQSSRALTARAAQVGVLIQPGRLDESRDAFTMGVTSIPQERIREGVRMLARAFHTRAPCARGEVATVARKTLSGAALRRAIVGKTFLYNTVYGEPCSIHVSRSGELIGMAGYGNDDPDRGRWWIDGDRWYRQWGHWAYGEAEGFAVAMDGERIYWYDDSDNLIDKAVILRKSPRKASATK